ncbi:hypothetical protein [Helicobacter fennelliae]|uniref:hypothetical protein n=1 Tax=Helicobacter fennelliae TaxID=215 RepID=UPI0011C0511A|nr:hypothetical protein [Helicobacter fennelliae]
MMSDIPSIIPGAVFIADSHFIPTHKSNSLQANFDDSYHFTQTKIWQGDLLSLLAYLELNPPPQVFLMGDIAHLFIGHIQSSIKKHRLFIESINALSLKTQVFYFEGNHDFGIDMCVFPRVKIYPRSLQPAHFMFESSNFLIAHGDCFISKSYECYIHLMSASFVLSCFKILDILTCGYLYTYIERKINARRIKNMPLCGEKLEKFAKERFAKYQQYATNKGISCLSGVIEGHFHIGEIYKNYISLPSFYCSKRVFIIESSKKNGERNG